MVGIGEVTADGEKKRNWGCILGVAVGVQLREMTEGEGENQALLPVLVQATGWMAFTKMRNTREEVK